MSKFLKIGGGVAAALLFGVVGLHLWSTSASSARLAQTWPEVQGKAVAVPMPMTEAEVASLRAELRAAGTDHTGAPLVATVAEDGTESLSDPLEGADLVALAGERAVARGQHLYNVRLACKECHKEDGGGGLVVDAQPVWTWYAPNITSGGKTASYAPKDWDRLVRHGVKPDDTNATMPAIDYMALSDRELSDVMAYVQSLPPVDTVQPETVLGPVGRMLLATGKMPIAAEEIDHSVSAVVSPPEPAATVAYGAHIAQVCVGCHRLAFEGGPIAAGPPDWPPAANLSADAFKSWTQDQFFSALRTGVRPDGTTLDPVAMPWALIGQWTDLELEAVFLYLQTLPAAATGT